MCWWRNANNWSISYSLFSLFFFSPNSTLNNNNITRIPVTSFNHMPKIRTLWVGSSDIIIQYWCCKPTFWLFVICDNLISVPQAASGTWVAAGLGSPWWAWAGWKGLVPPGRWEPLFWICPALSKSQFYQDFEFTRKRNWLFFFPPVGKSIMWNVFQDGTSSRS